MRVALRGGSFFLFCGERGGGFLMLAACEVRVDIG